MADYMDKYRDRATHVTLKQMEMIHSLKNKGTKLIAFAMIYMDGIFADKSGEFDLKYETIGKLTGYQSDQSRIIIEMLMNLRYIHGVRINQFKPIVTYKRKHRFNKFPNRYRLETLKDEGNSFYCIKYIDVKNNETLLSDYFKCYYQYYQYLGIKWSDMPRRFRDGLKLYVS